MRRCFNRAFSMRLNRLVNHGELNDTTDIRGWKGGGNHGVWGGGGRREELQVLTDYYNTVWFRVINSIPRCFDIICHSDVSESTEISTCCK